ncbi:hypothetical protein PF008_g13252 [Phytophthora fragariae]|uniref:Uncharacterized protein n=1 Tax=Phytophthora fragariae TaxID=53985 RepID=A0A6G0RKG7_9STRA|nr:hypothetical protein PF008_g13252 [Phytophthora fragariae]
MPLSVADSSCGFCGHSYADLQELPIPPEAYEYPKKQHGGPAARPPPLRLYTSVELEDAVQLEAQHIGGVRAAKAAIYRRDLCLSTREHEGADCDEYGEYLRGLSRTRFRVEHREDDAFRQDHVARALMTLPPSPDDARWPARCIAFAVSMLVFMLNLHWWSHAGSCFTKSSASASGQCRYNFPWARTSCSSDGITLARRAPFEFVNGFNTDIMLAFKSNHDIQVMIGGLGALLRIFYATKYVTKMQEHIDSITAVALAAFQSRQLREARDEESVANTDRATIGRRRVASLLYAITNRCEIAGPLAAHHVQRGSCAFMSTSCSTFHLRAILHELIDQVVYSWDLVELRGCDSSLTFRAASFLDDYSYRPPGLNNLNLYERSELVADPTSDAQWIDAFKQWEPTRSDFTREIMANMDDHCRTAMQDQECSGNAEPEADNEASSDSGEPTGMREDVEAVLDRATSSNQADPLVGGANHLFYCGESDGSSELELELHDENTDASALAPTLPVFPNAEPSVSSDAYRDLPGAAAHSTATMDVDLRSRGATLEFPLDELQRFVNDTTNDESEPQRSQQYCNERPTEVVALIIDALEDLQAWSPLPPNAPRSPPPVRPYASVQDVSRAHTLNERQDAAFALIATSLLRRFLRQELAGLQDIDGGCDRTAANLDARLRDDQLLLFLGGPGGAPERAASSTPSTPFA